MSQSACHAIDRRSERARRHRENARFACLIRRGGVALIPSAHPLIDAVSSFVERRWVNGAISTLAAAGLAVATFAGDAGAALAVFGAWAAVSGALQLGLALCRHDGWPMLISGGLSTVAGLSFVAAAGQDAAHLSTLAGYAAVGAVLYLVWTVRARGALAVS